MVFQDQKVMNRLYFYPKIDLSKVNSPNPYILNMEKSLAEYFTIVNKGHTKMGVLEFYAHLNKADSFVFNWIEDLPIKKFGKIQILFFLFFIFISKSMNKKIIWVLHNKYSHDVKKNWWTDLMFRVMVNYSDLIFTHSQEGIAFVSENFKGKEKKVFYMPHPMQPLFDLDSNKEKEYDLLIWGSIYPYKGVVEYLEKMEGENKGTDKIKVLIVGKCFDKAYLGRLKKCLNENTTFIDDFKTLEEIKVFAQKSRFIFFPYISSSLLSSGTLMDSMRMGVKILGPNTGAFKDLSYMNLIEVYDDFSEIQKKIKTYETLELLDINELKAFFNNNTWEKFGAYFYKVYKSLDN